MRVKKRKKERTQREKYSGENTVATQKEQIEIKVERKWSDKLVLNDRVERE